MGLLGGTQLKTETHILSCPLRLLSKLSFLVIKAWCLWQVPWDAVLKGVKDYDPKAMAMWKEGQPAPYLHVGRALASMDSTTKRLRISDVIANMFRSLLALSPGELRPFAPACRVS